MSKTTFPLALAALLSTLPALADHLEELVVTATHDTRTIDVAHELEISPDVAQLLKKAPGANVNSNGPISGIPQYRGMYGSRVAVSMDGAHIAPSGPNWMDPPLSYAVGGQLESLEVYRGIAPVSVAQESIGGAVDVKSIHGSFTDSEHVELAGRVIANTQSVNEAYHVESAVFAANRNNRVRVAAMTENGNDADFPGGHIRPTQYERQRYDLGYGFRRGDHSVQLDYGYNDTGDSGTPALPMDIKTITGDLYGVTYNFTRDESMRITAALYGSDLDHQMTNYLLREAPAPGQWRRNTASSDNLGFKFSALVYDQTGTTNLGLDGFSAKHNSDIDTPNSPTFFVENFNRAERKVLGVFLERQQEINERWRAEFGLRYNRVAMNSGEINGSPAMMMPPARVLRDTFNNSQLKQNDDNIDAVAKAWYRATDHSSWYVGVAQKTRSPSYQERYLWLPLEATAGLADGYTYTGTVNLDPEVSRQIDAGLDYSNGTWTVSPRIYYSRVDDYIEGVPSEDAAAIAFVRMMNVQNGTDDPDPLQFANIDAELYGFDMDWAWQFAAQWSLSGLVNYVRGERDDTVHDNLYRIAAPNATFRLNYTAATWTAALETVLFDKQDKVCQTNNEQKTSGYELVNVSATWQVTAALQLATGVDNVFDSHYEDHLGGYNRAANPDIPIGARLPGYGANLYARVMYEF
jgi:iron complex outermembrane receptor protein